MTDQRKLDSIQDPIAGNPRPTKAAIHMVAAMVRDIGNNLDPLVMSKLHNAVLSPTPEAATKVIQELVAKGVRAIDLTDFYIPAVARELGDQWCIDELGFAEVTIGSARLQSMLHALDKNWTNEATDEVAAASVLLVVPCDVHHTLGALVLSGQLRRKGLSVKLVLGGQPLDIARRTASNQYDCVFISSPRGGSLEDLRDVISAVKRASSDPVPIVVGGSILEIETAQTLTAFTGADFATKDPQEALNFCGLQSTTHSLART